MQQQQQQSIAPRADQKEQHQVQQQPAAPHVGDGPQPERQDTDKVCLGHPIHAARPGGGGGGGGARAPSPRALWRDAHPRPAHPCHHGSRELLPDGGHPDAPLVEQVAARPQERAQPRAGMGDAPPLSRHLCRHDHRLRARRRRQQRLRRRRQQQQQQASPVGRHGRPVRRRAAQGRRQHEWLPSLSRDHPQLPRYAHACVLLKPLPHALHERLRREPEAARARHGPGDDGRWLNLDAPAPPEGAPRVLARDQPLPHLDIRPGRQAACCLLLLRLPPSLGRGLWRARRCTTPRHAHVR